MGGEPPVVVVVDRAQLFLKIVQGSFLGVRLIVRETTVFAPGPHPLDGEPPGRGEPPIAGGGPPKEGLGGNSPGAKSKRPNRPAAV